MSYHDEIRELVEGLDALTLRHPQTADYHFVAPLRAQADRLLAMPEDVVEKLVQAAQLGVEAVEAALPEQSLLGGQTENFAPGFAPPE